MQRKIASLVAVVAAVCVAPLGAQAAGSGPRSLPPPEAPLTNAEIVKLTNAGLSPDLIVMKVRQAPSEDLDVSTDALIALRQQHVSDVVIAAIFERVLKKATPSPPAEASPIAEPPAARATPAAPARQGPEPFPDLELHRADGGSLRLSQLRSKVILIIVWATWNPPSGKELPIIQKLYDSYRNRSFDVVGRPQRGHRPDRGRALPEEARRPCRPISLRRRTPSRSRRPGSRPPSSSAPTAMSRRRSSGARGEAESPRWAGPNWTSAGAAPPRA